jgi:integrase
MDNDNIIRSFKFPKKTFEFRVNVPTKEQLQAFYSVLGTPMEKAIFLFYCTTGLRRKEVLRLRMDDVNFDKRMVIPKANSSRTKHTGITFYNGETEATLKEYLLERNNLEPEALLFPMSDGWIQRVFDRAKTKSGISLSPQILREWFSTELGSLKVPDRFVDFFAGRVPKSVLARHYTDFNPERLKEIYDKSEIRVLS